jgi:hypothetical protein
MGNIKISKDSLEWIAFKVFMFSMFSYATLLVTMVLLG